MSIIKNPMIMMMLVSVGLMFLMPKMMEGLEPEEREQMKRQMEMQQNPGQMIGELFGGITGATEQPSSTKPKRKTQKQSKENYLQM